MNKATQNFQFIKPYSKGQITIPKKFREKLDIDEDTWLSVFLQDEFLIIKPVNKQKKSSQRYKQPDVSLKKYKNIVSDLKQTYNARAVEDLQKVKKETEEKLQKMDL